MAKFDLIVEGPDGAGKSTLVRTLVEAGAAHISMLGGRTKDPGEMRRFTASVTYNPIPGGRVIERYHPISDEVYRAVFGGPRVFGSGDMEMFADRLGVKGSSFVVVYCRPPLDVIRATPVTAKGDDDPEWVDRIKRGLPEIVKAYDYMMIDLALFHRVRVIHYDYTVPWADYIVKRLKLCVA